MKLEDHEQRSVDRFGIKFTEVHKYLDQYFFYFRYDAHRCILHHLKGAQKIARLLSEIYGPHVQDMIKDVALLHIKDDMNYVFEEFSDFAKEVYFLTEEDYKLAEEFYSKEFP